MTGYGKAECEVNNRKLIIEVKSLNSKILDLGVRIPAIYRDKELELRKDIAEQLLRGKIELVITLDEIGDTAGTEVNERMVLRYFHQLSRIQEELGLPVTEQIMSNILRLPETIRAVAEQADEAEWNIVVAAIRNVVGAVDRFRRQEGKAMERDIRANIAQITELAATIDAFEPVRNSAIRNRIREGLNSLELQIDENRFEQELIYYIEKLDINEEKVRLSNHCRYFCETIDETEPTGRKLSFIAQEIGREINTIGSKANESNIQQTVVKMKDALEKIKEQLSNVL
jgi:uncharacterized protein (TIGR00255 family)